MRISDWSSDVCSSDLQDRAAHEEQMGQEKRPADAQPVDDVSDAEKDKRLRAVVGGHQQPELRHGKVEVALEHRRHGKDRQDRKSGGEGKSVAVGVVLGGRRHINKKTKKTKKK